MKATGEMEILAPLAVAGCSASFARPNLALSISASPLSESRSDLGESRIRLNVKEV